MKLLTCAFVLSATLMSVAQPSVMEVNTKKLGAPIQSTMYGIFFEDINYAADGGLYGELIKNRSFEFPQHLMGWQTFGCVDVEDDHAPFERCPHYVVLSDPGHKDRRTGLVNEGYFGIANKGTIFLDEVGELPMATQARLLRVLETGEYIRVGGTEIRKTDVRIVAATNVNMQKAISEGRFREDLYYRLNTIPIQMPPLRERGQDIILLFRLFAMQMAEKYRLPKVTLSEEAKQIMLNYKWPGNVRQLKNITEQMSILSPEREIGRETLLQYIPQDKESMQLAVINNNSEHSYESEREILYKILYELRGNVSDLRRELNNVRRQMEEVRDLNGAAAFSPAPHPSAIAPINTTAITPHPSSNTQQNDFAIAEEISEPENLNLSEVGKQVLLKALERNNGNRKKAAKELGISDRTLYRKLKLYNLEDETAKD